MSYIRRLRAKDSGGYVSVQLTQQLRFWLPYKVATALEIGKELGSNRYVQTTV